MCVVTWSDHQQNWRSACLPFVESLPPTQHMSMCQMFSVLHFTNLYPFVTVVWCINTVVLPAILHIIGFMAWAVLLVQMYPLIQQALQLPSLMWMFLVLTPKNCPILDTHPEESSDSRHSPWMENCMIIDTHYEDLSNSRYSPWNAWS